IVIDQANRGRDTAGALVEELRRRSDSLKKEMAALTARVKAQRTRFELLADEKKAEENAKAKVKAADARVEQADVDFAIAQLQLDRMAVKALDSGRVYKLVAHPGARVGSSTRSMNDSDGSTVVTLYQPNSLQVRVDVRFEDLQKIRLTQKVRIENPALSKPLTGTVLFKSSLTDIQKNTREVKVAIDNPPRVFKPEMLVDVTFLAPKPPQRKETSNQELRLYIPKQLVKQGDGGSFVWVADRSAGVARKTPVKLGVITGDGLVEITKGLTMTSRVIVSGDEGLEDGDRIQITEEK
ncbi:MAG: efflux RND transporter periplasmic adaptor subunit, partial [Planctomycetes bacterium]|nr:efflux RND transporter periplasmic adaptor subunit [Planctomycetota bacterium]